MDTRKTQFSVTKTTLKSQMSIYCSLILSAKPFRSLHLSESQISSYLRQIRNLKFLKLLIKFCLYYWQLLSVSACWCWRILEATVTRGCPVTDEIRGSSKMRNVGKEQGEEIDTSQIVRYRLQPFQNKKEIPVKAIYILSIDYRLYIFEILLYLHFQVFLCKKQKGVI